MLREKSCGVVPYRQAEGQVLYLVISSALTRREHWEFPKGGVEEGENETETALRELREETGVSAVELVRGFREPIHYVYRRPEGLISKQVVYFLGLVKDPAVVLRVEECKDYRWATYEEAKKLLRHSNARSLLDRAQGRITGVMPPAAPPSPEGSGQRRKRRRQSGRGGGERPAAVAPEGQSPQAAAVAGQEPQESPAEPGPAGKE